MNLLSLLTEASVALQRYAIDGAILIKSVNILTLLLILNTNTTREVSYALYATPLLATCILMR